MVAKQYRAADRKSRIARFSRMKGREKAPSLKEERRYDEKTKIRNKKYKITMALKIRFPTDGFGEKPLSSVSRIHL